MRPDSIKAVEICAVVLGPRSCDGFFVIPEPTGYIREWNRRHQLSGVPMCNFLPWAVWKCGIIDPSIGTQGWPLSAPDIYRLEGVAQPKASSLYENQNKSTIKSHTREMLAMGEGERGGGILTISVPPLIFPICVCFGKPLS